MVTIIDYGIGNLRSIEKAFQSMGIAVTRTDDPDEIGGAARLVLPGVGAFGACMGELEERRLVRPIYKAVEAGVPFLGVCVGMQLLFEESNEQGAHEGLGILPGRVIHFHDNEEVDESLTAPHMGWNTLHVAQPLALLEGVEQNDYFYFVHSYHAAPEEPEDIAATTTYGRPVPAIVGRNNVFGVQFHPEKSQRSGLQILQNFSRLDG